MHLIRSVNCVILCNGEDGGEGGGEVDGENGGEVYDKGGGEGGDEDGGEEYLWLGYMIDFKFSDSEGVSFLIHR